MTYEFNQTAVVYVAWSGDYVISGYVNAICYPCRIPDVGIANPS